MTRCMRKEVNLKSSAYNQTGQNYYEQLAAYNSMNSHLRRILLAKKVVDTKNKSYFKRNQRCKVQRASGSGIYLEATDDVIDRLAYDTQHHPMDILRIDLNAKHLDCCNYNLDHQLRICSSQTCYEGTDQMDHRQRSKNQRMMSSTARSPKRKKFSISNSVCKKELKSTRDISHIVGPSTCFSRQRKYRYKKDSFLIPCATTRLDSTIFKLRSQSLRQKAIILQDDYRSVSSSVSQCYDFDCNEKSTEEVISKQFLSQKEEEEKKYVKFVYDITKEIMQRGLYTDKELQDVFKKHVNQYKGILNMNKMLYEIYQLKISLNIDDSDIDEELEDLIHAQKLLSVSEIRPPTPPKILDENKVMAKLESYQKMMKAEKFPNANKKSVMLIDANPELVITERDVLMLLVEADIDPKQIQYICKNLRCRSRDVDLTEAAQIDTETLYPPDLEVDNLELEDNDKQVTAKSDRDNSVAHNSIKSSVKQEASSSTSNLVSTQDEIIETEEKTESEIISEHDKAIETEEKTESEIVSEHDKAIETEEKTESEIVSEHDKAIETEEKTESEIVSEHDKAIETEEKTESEIVSEHDKTIETEEKTESEIVSEHDKAIETKEKTESEIVSEHDKAIETEKKTESEIVSEHDKAIETEEKTESEIVSEHDKAIETKEKTESEIVSEHDKAIETKEKTESEIVSEHDKAIETEEKTESEITSEHDKAVETEEKTESEITSEYDKAES